MIHACHTGHLYNIVVQSYCIVWGTQVQRTQDHRNPQVSLLVVKSPLNLESRSNSNYKGY